MGLVVKDRRTSICYYMESKAAKLFKNSFLYIYHTSTVDYNWLGIGIRIGFLASSSMYYIREQFISSTYNKIIHKWSKLQKKFL